MRTRFLNQPLTKWEWENNIMNINKTALIKAIDSGKCQFIGIIEQGADVFHLMTLGKLVFSGSPTNPCFLVAWDLITTFEEWEDPAAAWIEAIN